MRSDPLYLSDLSDGTYQNPVLFADYSDPDVIASGDTFYLTASSFNYVPGLPILTSKDLVNWRLQNYALPNLPEARYAVPRHAQGVWAPAIRRHGGRFYIFYGMPDEGVFQVGTDDPLGRWDAPVCVLAGKGLIDPCPFWDEDGTAWVVHGYAKSRIGFKSFLGIFPISADGRRAVGPDRLLYDGRASNPTVEGPKVYKRGGFYYIFAPAGGVEHGWQTVLRGLSLQGPFEERVVLRQGDSPVNGPHQGAWVHTPAGEDWFLHFQSRGCYGRVVHLQPLHWADDWPVVGQSAPGETYGTPVLRHRKPSAPPCAPEALAASDDFSGPTLDLQWQFMGAWRPDFYDLTARPGRLRLFAHPAPAGQSPVLWRCPQALTQKLVCPGLRVETGVEFTHLLPGAKAGLALLGGQYAYAAVRMAEGGAQLVLARSRGEGDEREEEICCAAALSEDTLRLRLTLTPLDGASARAAFFFAQGDAPFVPLGEPFIPGRHTWVGARIALFSMAQADAGEPLGYADFLPFQAERGTA